jgi:hypothetical protein
MTSAPEAHFDPIVYETLFFHPLANAHLAEEVYGSLFQDPGANALLGVFTAAILDYNRIDTIQIQKMGKH